MKKTVVSFLLYCIMILSLAACGNDTANMAEESYSSDDSIETMSEVEQIDAQLQGTWISYDSDTRYSKWTFYNGTYVADTYVNGEKLENSIIGTYAIGADAIHTITIDQENNAEGSIPYSFEDGVLSLNPISGAVVEKADSIEDETIEIQDDDTEEVSQEFDVEALIEEADILDWSEVYNDMQENQARAEDYNGVWYVYTAEVISIGTESCVLSGDSGADDIEVCLEKDELKELNKGDAITIIGRFNSLPEICYMPDAVILNHEMISENFVFAVVSESGRSSYQYSDYTYDSSIGQIVSYDVSGDEQGKHVLTYNESGQLISDALEKLNAKYGVETHTYTYYEDGTLKTEMESYTTENVREGTTFEYTHELNQSGQVIKTTVVNVTSDNQYTLVYEYEYDSNGNVIKEKQTSPNSVYIIEYTYDEFGNVSSETSYNEETPSSKSVTLYEYSIIAKK